MQRNSQQNESDNLFRQIKDLGKSLEEKSNIPVLDEIRNQIHAEKPINGLINNAQIQRILEYVPSIFPESWKSPEKFSELSKKEKEACFKIIGYGSPAFYFFGPFIGSTVQRVMELGVAYRGKHEGN